MTQENNTPAYAAIFNIPTILKIGGVELQHGDTIDIIENDPDKSKYKPLLVHIYKRYYTNTIHKATLTLSSDEFNHLELKHIEALYETSQNNIPYKQATKKISPIARTGNFLGRQVQNGEYPTLHNFGEGRYRVYLDGIVRIGKAPQQPLNKRSSTKKRIDFIECGEEAILPEDHLHIESGLLLGSISQTSYKRVREHNLGANSINLSPELFYFQQGTLVNGPPMPEEPGDYQFDFKNQTWKCLMTETEILDTLKQLKKA